jgi:hypothetical protein
MRKFLSLIVVLMLAFNVKAQGLAITEAADFTFSDNGTEKTLFEVLDNGQHALLYFFNYQSEVSEEKAPIINGVYNSLGMNQEDVYLIGLDPANESILLNNWAVITDVKYPLVAKDKAYYISQTYGGQWGVMMPALVLIAPNHDIILEEIWPITSADQVVGIINENIGGSNDEPEEPGDEPEEPEEPGDEPEEPEYPEETTVPAAPVINVYAENSGLVVVEWEAVETAIFYYVYYNGSLVGDGQVMGTEVEILVNPETTYCFTVTAVNTVGESEHSNEACATTPAEEGEEPETPENPEGNIEIAENNFNIYPNPATSEVKITSAMNGEAEINIFDMTGRCVKNIRVANINDATINVSDINKGVYFINVAGNIEKLIIK